MQLANLYMILHGFYTCIINCEVILTYVNQFGRVVGVPKGTIQRSIFHSSRQAAPHLRFRRMEDVSRAQAQATHQRAYKQALDTDTLQAVGLGFGPRLGGDLFAPVFWIPKLGTSKSNFPYFHMIF